MNARQCALLALTDWENTSAYAEDVLADRAKQGSLSSADRALATDLLYGVIRNLFLVDRLIDELRHGKIKASTQDLLRLGLYQIFLSGIADHAAVNETVELARKHERGLVNAILRNALRQRDSWDAEIKTWSLEDRYSHPQFLIDRWTEQFGEDAAAEICEWNNRIPENFARFNPLASKSEEGKRIQSEIEPSSLEDRFPGFFRFEGAPNLDWISGGFIYVQDPSTSIACRLLDPQPGETILDACAAPGGKAAFLAGLMKNEGKLVATDNSPKRLERTRENLERLHVSIADVREVDWSEDSLPSDLPKFDAILLDVPCSNSGVMRRRVDVRWRLQPGNFSHQSALQKSLLKSASRLLKPEGRLVYSTCSIDQEENEAVIESSGMKIERVEQCLPWKDGYDGAFAALLRH